MPPRIGVTSSSDGRVKKYLQAVERAGGQGQALLPEANCAGHQVLAPLDGLLLSGGGDVDSRLYGEEPHANSEKPNRKRDLFEKSLIEVALGCDMPILAICRGLQILNVTLGGRLVQSVPGHEAQGQKSSFHEVFIAPGSKMAVIVGQGHGGFPWVNSRHHQGMNLARLAKGLHATVYGPRDGLIEAVESHYHSFVVGVQWHPEREEDYQPRSVMAPKFRNLFTAFVWATEAYQERKS